MNVTIMQPAYLPWLGFFDRVDASDLFIVLDNVQLDTNSKTRFTNRNKIRTKDGWTWLTLPMRTKGLYRQANINQIELVQDKWAKKHWRSIEMNYRKAPFFAKQEEALRTFYQQKWIKMQPLLEATTKYLLEQLGITTKIVNASEIKVEGNKDDLILNLCRKVGANTYYSGIFGRDYLQLNRFVEAGIEVRFHDYQHPTYTQQYPGFEPYMCVLDLLFNHGEESLEIIRKGRNFTP